LIYNKLGNTDLIVSRLGFGLMRLPLSKINPDFSYSVQLIQGAVQHGVNFFDVGTFYCHNHCESAFGNAITPELRKNLVFTGKNSTHQIKNLSWTDQLLNTLKAFKIDILDIYFLHYLNLKTWNEYYLKFRVIDQINKARQQGYFKYIGFSSHDSPENVKTMIDSHFFDAVILQNNLLETGNQVIIRYAKKKGLGVIIMNPLAGGLLTKTDSLLSTDLTIQPRLKQLALKYVFNNPDVHCVLSGMRSISEMEENIRILENPEIKNDEISKALSVIKKAEKGKWMYCTDCKYCLPCPQGIDIPEVIRIYNKYCLFKTDKLFSRDYSLLVINAGCCIECAICESKCPNAIPIMKIMNESAEMYYE
jgi:predicted aldo/keto reductase-like oxidoreductase